MQGTQSKHKLYGMLLNLNFRVLLLSDCRGRKIGIGVKTGAKLLGILVYQDSLCRQRVEETFSMSCSATTSLFEMPTSSDSIHQNRFAAEICI